ANRCAVVLAQHGDRALLDAVERGAELAEKSELMLRGLDDARFVFVLDDVHRVEDEAVRTFLGDAIARTKNGKLVLASREHPRYNPALPHVRLVHLAGLDDDEVRRFLEAKGVKVDERLFPKIRDEVGGHPLALNLFLEAAAAEGGGIEKLLDRIPEKNLEEYLLAEIHERLADDERQVLALASVFRTSFALEDLAAISTKNPENALYKLRRRLLVQSYEGDYALHEVVRNFGYAQLKNKKSLHEKAAAHYLSQGSVEGRFEALHHLLAAGRREKVLELLEENLDLREFDFIDTGYQNLYLSVLELFKKSEVKDARRWALIEDEKGDIHFHRGDYKRALEHYDEARTTFEKLKEPQRIADLCWKRAMASARLGKKKQAQELVERGLKVAAKGTRERERLDELAKTFR
ncbi:MAG: tetratricopeptide repeat protein, partial [Methanobacteriota archaeon]